MAIYYKIRNADDSIVGQPRDMPDGFDPSTLSHKFGPQHDYRIIPEAILPDPTIDEATQYLGRQLRTVQADRVDVIREVVDRSAEEIADETERDQVKAVAIALRDGTGNNLQRLQRVERVLFRLIKDMYGDQP